MKLFESMRFTGKIVAAALAVAVIGMSTTTTFAATKDTANLQSDLEQYTKNVETVVAPDGMVEYHTTIEALNNKGLTVVNHEDTGTVYRPQAMFGPYTEVWTVNPNTRHVSGPIRLPKNNSTINAVSTVTPATKSYMLGVMDNNGYAYYVRGQGAASHSFTGLTKATYRVFVQNNYTDGTTLNANVIYNYLYND